MSPPPDPDVCQRFPRTRRCDRLVLTGEGGAYVHFGTYSDKCPRDVQTDSERKAQRDAVYFESLGGRAGWPKET